MSCVEVVGITADNLMARHYDYPVVVGDTIQGRVLAGCFCLYACHGKLGYAHAPVPIEVLPYRF